MLATRDFVFSHLPKTGGTWVLEAIQAARIPYCQIERDIHAYPTDVTREVFPGKTFFTVVRHPVTWWYSYWHHSHSRAWPASGALWDPVMHQGQRKIEPDFGVFMERVLRECPGFYGEVVRKFTAHADLVLHTEHLAAELGRVISPVPPVVPANTGGYAEPDLGGWPARICEAERYVVERFYG